MNNKVNALAKAALTGNQVVNMSDFRIPSGWADTVPMISSQSLKCITEHVVKDTIPPLLGQQVHLLPHIMAKSHFRHIWPLVGHGITRP